MKLRFLPIHLLGLLFALTSLSESRVIHGSNGIQSSGGALINIANSQYYTGYNWSLNWWKQASSTVLVSSSHGTLSGQAVWDNGTYFDTTTGELVTPTPADVTSISRVFFTPVPSSQYQYAGTAFGQFANQVWDVSWTGCASPTVTVTGNTGGGSSSFGANSGTVTFGPTVASFANVGLTFTLTAGCYANPPKNIIVSQHQYAANVAAGELTNPDWRVTMRPFKFARLMDLMAMNGSGITDSSQLQGLSYVYYGSPFNMAWASSFSSISGSVLTSSGHAGENWRVGQSIVCAGCTVGTVISSFGTGTGGDGTYNLNKSMTISNTKIMGVDPVGYNQEFGPRGGIGPDVACKIANELQTGIEYPIPIAATNQYVTDIATSLNACTNRTVKISLGNENWNFSFFQTDYSVAQAFAASLASGYQWAGYRAAQVFSIVRSIYGSNSSASGRWLGAIGSQMASPSPVTVDGLAGAQTAITAGGLAPLTQLASQVDVAPYLGDFTNPVVNVCNITASATPTVTASNDDGIGNPVLTNGTLIKMFVVGGTMAAALNNQYATVSAATTTSFQINISTSGLVYSGSTCVSQTGSDYAMPATLFKLADQSLALNGSTPATYPTKYSYFAQQMSKSILNGSATDPSYGTITWQAAVTLTGSAGSIQNLFSQHALDANVVGLAVGQYEGGIGVSLVNRSQSNPAAQMIDYLTNWQFDAGVTGDSTNTVGNLYAVSRARFCSLQGGYSSYPAQYSDAAAQSQFGPWGALRFFPGDTGNPKWTAIAAWNTAGACVDPTPATTGTYIALNGGAPFETNSSTNAQPISGVAYGTGSSYAIIVAYSQNSPGISSIDIDGTTLNLDVSHSTLFSRIYSGLLPSGAATRAITVNWTGAAFFQRGVYALKATGLLNNAVASISTTGLGAGGPVSELKGSLIVCGGELNGGTPNYSGSSIAPSAFNNASGGFGTAGWWLGNTTFSSSIFSCAWGGGSSGGAVIATYR